MKKAAKIFSLLIAICSLLTITTCSDGSDEATISINLDLFPVKVAADVSINQLEHVIVLSGPTGEQTLRVTGGGTVRATVAAGVWSIRVTAYYDNEVYAVGSATVEVRAGRNTDVNVQMTVVWDDSPPTTTGGGGGGSGYTPPGGTPATVGESLISVKELSRPDKTSITLITDPPIPSNGQSIEYAYDKTADATTLSQWQPSPTFTGLTEFETYYFFARSKENASFLAGDKVWSDPITIGELITTWADLDAKINSASGTATFLIGGTLEVDTTGSTIAINGSKDITLLPNGFVYIVRNGYPGAFFNVSPGKLTLSRELMDGTITLDGANSSANDALINVGSSSSLYMYEGVTLQNNNNTAGDGGAVKINGDNAEFEMSGGTITGNKAQNGGGVYAKANTTGPTIKMSSYSAIDNNVATGDGTAMGMGGGVCIIIGSGGGSFEMEDSAITNNQNTFADPSSSAEGGGVYFNNSTAALLGTFKMSGYSKITGNKIPGNAAGKALDASGGGVFFQGLKMEMAGYAEISSNEIEADSTASGGGLYIGGGDLVLDLDDYAGGISDNTAIAHSTGNAQGGGVYFGGSGAFTLKGSSKINGNTAMTGPMGTSIGGQGGGIYLGSGNLTMSDNSEIKGNTAQGAAYNSFGGGVYVNLQGGATFIKNSGTIDGNPGPILDSSNNIVIENIPFGYNLGHAVYAYDSGPAYGLDRESGSTSADNFVISASPVAPTSGTPPGWDF